uniref:BHLH domain-containing protein n=1 Tax=Setaria digitata TaxID=48799 RepID=A0A915PP97_9BILA
MIESHPVKKNRRDKEVETKGREIVPSAVHTQTFQASILASYCSGFKTKRGPEDESPSYHTGSSEPPNDLISPPMGGSIDTTDRRLRRQIANCNERRRMQSINAGFQSLKLLLPRRDGEKLSKAAILQHTVELIQTLRAEKMKLIEEKETVINAKKRKIQDENMRERGVIGELTAALEHERRLRHLYERMFNLWTNSPVLSQFLAKPNTSVINPAIALQNVVPPILQTRGFTGIYMNFDFKCQENLLLRRLLCKVLYYLPSQAAPSSNDGVLPPALLIDNLLTNARISNNSCGTGSDNASGGAGQLQTTSFDLNMFTGNLVSETAVSAIAADNEARFIDDRKPSPSQIQSAAIGDLLAQPSPFLFNSLENASGANLNSNFYTILEAIRQLEESSSTFNGSTSTSTVNQQQQQQQPNVLRYREYRTESPNDLGNLEATFAYSLL